MASLKYSEFDMNESELHSISRSINAHKSSSLPGSANRQPGMNARLSFSLDGQTETRYFRTQAESLKVKANYRGIWRPHSAQYWHHKDLTWC